MAHAFNLQTQEARADKSEFKTAWPKELVSGQSQLHIETLSQKQKRKRNRFVGDGQARVYRSYSNTRRDGSAVKSS